MRAAAPCLVPARSALPTTASDVKGNRAAALIIYPRLSQKSPETGNSILDVQNRKFGVEFTEVPKGVKQGDKEQEIALPFIYLDETHE